MSIKTVHVIKISSILGGVLFLCMSAAHANYPCPLGFYYVNYEGCVPNYNTHTNVVWGTTVVPAGAAAVGLGHYNVGVGHYNVGGGTYYHRNWGGPNYYNRY